MAEIYMTKTDEERAEVFRFRYEIYVEELHIFDKDADHETRQQIDIHDDGAHLMVARDSSGELVGTLRANFGHCPSNGPEFEETYDLSRFCEVVSPERVLIISRFMVTYNHRGKSLAGKMVMRIAQFALQHGIEVALLDCQPHLVGLYQRLGFQTYKRAYNDPNFGVMVPMVLFLSDLEHHRATRSMLAPILAENEPLAAESMAALRAMIPAMPPARGTTAEDLASLRTAMTEGSRSSSLFRDLEEDEIGNVLGTSFLLECELGDHLIAKGQTTRTLYLVVAGRLEVRVNGKRIGTARAGDLLGEVSFLIAAPRCADVVVTGYGTRVIAMCHKLFDNLMETDPLLAARCFRNLSRGLCWKLARRRALPARTEEQAVPAA